MKAALMTSNDVSSSQYVFILEPSLLQQLLRRQIRALLPITR